MFREINLASLAWHAKQTVPVKPVTLKIGDVPGRQVNPESAAINHIRQRSERSNKKKKANEMLASFITSGDVTFPANVHTSAASRAKGSLAN